MAHEGTRDAVRAHAAGRILVGAGLMLAPRLAGRSWIGTSAGEGPTGVYSRALGIRDVTLGAGLLMALGDREARRPWLLAGIAADAVDFVATVVARDDLPATGRTVAPAVAAGSAAAGIAALLLLD